MTKDTRDVKIEQQDNIIRCLAETAAKYKQELDLVKQERDSVVCDSILVKAQSDAISMTSYFLNEGDIKKMLSHRF